MIKYFGKLQLHVKVATLGDQIYSASLTISQLQLSNYKKETHKGDREKLFTSANIDQREGIKITKTPQFLCLGDD